MEIRSLYDQPVFDHTLSRVEKLTDESQPQWGKMDVAQMMSHCAEVLDVSNGKPLKNTPFLVKLFKGYIKKMVVGPKPYAKSTRTHPQYLQTGTKDFQREKQHLLNSLARFKELEGQKTEHALFGELTREEKGWGMYKHLDHHLVQFGV